MEFENISFLVFIPLALVFLIFFLRHTFVKNSENKRLRFYVLITRFLMIAILIIALSAPYTSEITTEKKQDHVNILIDHSKSMHLYHDQSQNLVDRIKSSTKLDVNLIKIGSDYNSPIGNALMNNMRGNDNIILISDGNVNSGRSLKDVLSFASIVNSTVNIVRLNEKENDASISIQGPKYVLSSLTNTFHAEVKAVGNVNYDVVIKLDGMEIKRFSGNDNKIEEFDLNLKKGHYKLEAELITNDYNLENNLFYKTITVLDKPSVLYVTHQSSPAEKIFREIYDLDIKNAIPNNLEKYFGIIINNIPASSLDPHIDKLSNYVLDGNGLMVIGGDNSYDLGGYQDSQFQNILPARVGIGDIDVVTDLNIIIVLDISASLGVSENDAISLNIEKAQAINLINDLDSQDNLGVIAFNTEAHIISELMPVENQPQTTSKISQLVFGGGTHLIPALIEAERMLEKASGNKNIIIISDGKIMQHRASNLETNMKIKSLKDKGVTTYVLGVGPETDEDFMINLAMIGGGSYFKLGSEKRLSMIFEKERNHDLKEWSLIPFNQNHFITNGIDLNAKISGYNQVVPKSSAQMLVSTESRNPIITVWRFGLGRVVSLTTDGGRDWAGQVLREGNSGLISRSANWAVGDPRRKDSVRLRINDGRIHEDMEFSMYSEKIPEMENVDLIQNDVNLYTGIIKPDNVGFFKIENEEFAVSYPREYQNIGLSQDLEYLVSLTGGAILDINDLDEVVKKIENDNEREIEDRNYFRHYYLPIVVIIYLIEILLRRKIKDNREV